MRFMPCAHWLKIGRRPFVHDLFRQVWSALSAMCAPFCIINIRINANMREIREQVGGRRLPASCTLPVRCPGAAQVPAPRLLPACCPPATSKNMSSQEVVACWWCVGGHCLGGARQVHGRLLGPCQAHAYLDYNSCKNCHRRPWQEKGLFLLACK